MSYSEIGYSYLSVEYYIDIFPALKNYFVSVCLHEFFIPIDSMYFRWATLLLKETLFI